MAESVLQAHSHSHSMNEASKNKKQDYVTTEGHSRQSEKVPANGYPPARGRVWRKPRPQTPDPSPWPRHPRACMHVQASARPPVSATHTVTYLHRLSSTSRPPSAHQLRARPTGIPAWRRWAGGGGASSGRRVAGEAKCQVPCARGSSSCRHRQREGTLLALSASPCSTYWLTPRGMMVHLEAYVFFSK